MLAEKEECSAKVGSNSVHWCIWFNQLGAEAMEHGRFWQAAQSFELALSSLLFGSSLTATVYLPEEIPINERPDHESNSCSFMFGTALAINVTQPEQTNYSGTALLTLRASIMLNLSISLHQVGLTSGFQACLTTAKCLYQATLQLLHSIGRTHAILIGVYAFQNLAVLHYMHLEYSDCYKCLQSLRWMTQQGFRENVLDDITLQKVTMAMFFYARAPITAACA